ncbi:MAG: hypothetical protein GEU73_07685 [Chloroflexi bacterium]|nr:hypothetical protein [Chloroflexota bacterium]
MSRTAALTRARSLREALLDHGVRAVSIELMQGRSASAWNGGAFIGCMGHHTVSRPSMGDTPVLSLCKTGRSDVPGPLCNGYGGYDRIARIICMGYANHPGYGGPVTVEKGTVPKNNARPYFFGWEMEGGIEKWTDAMHDFMDSCFAGTVDWLRVSERSHVEHKTWAPTRKIDRLNVNLPDARARIAAVLEGEDDPMARLTDQQMAKLERMLDAWIDPREGIEEYARDSWKIAKVLDWVTKDSDPDDIMTKAQFVVMQVRELRDTNPKLYQEAKAKAGL